MSGAVLAVDIGGSKILAGLVDGARVVETRRLETARDASADAWVDSIIMATADWRGRFGAVGAAVTGWIRDGRWGALNPEVLPVPDGFPLVDRLTAGFGVPVLAANDAQAAAVGEWRHGAGRGVDDMVFLTVSTGVGGGVISNGRLVLGHGGIAGNIGQTPVETADGERRLEDLCSGSALARLAAATGRPGDARTVVAAANAGDVQAEQLLSAIVEPLARALRALQFTLDPARFVIGGGLGLADGFLDRIRAALSGVPAVYRPDVRAAALGADAGLIGIADLVTTRTSSAPEVKP
jgi:N-acetylmannosamine-6-phosphate 2-epimerase/N-acetylmannosamine kinase